MSRRMEQYKSFGRAKESQKKRREKVLLLQKQRRRRQFDLTRGIIVEAASDDEEDVDDCDNTTRQQQQQQLQQQQHLTEAENPTAMDENNDEHNGEETHTDMELKPNAFKHHSTTKKRKYANQLMEGEVFETAPDDIADNWQCVVCPKGRRCLIVSHNGYTQAFNKYGKSIVKFSSFLPGGGREVGCHRGSSVIDAIFNADDSTFYVLDIIYWHGMHILDSPFDFRTFWLQSKWEERPEITEVCEGNEYAMIALQRLPCDNDTIRAYLSNVPNADAVDGLSLYFTESVYEPGESPMMLWISADRIDEIIGEG
eukprot:m.23374 g.23374  ORF g.23374 m.23374 type:complete len:312 (-) comp8970_c0_seq1:63-998(-)